MASVREGWQRPASGMKGFTKEGAACVLGRRSRYRRGAGGDGEQGVEVVKAT